MPKKYDITFVGHMCYDEIIPFGGKPHIAPGSAVLCGAMVAARIGKHVAAVVKMAKKDEGILQPMKDAGVETYVIASAETTYSRVLHESENVDERKLTLVKSAGLISIDDVPELRSTCVHLAGISDTEFDMPLMKGLKSRGYSLSADMQDFVRHVTPVTHDIEYSDVANKKEIAAMMDKLKLDVVEARILTGTEDLEQAAIIVESWGCPETLITHSQGVLARVKGVTYYEKFSNSNVSGRTGRGDTTFAAYLVLAVGSRCPGIPEVRCGAGFNQNGNPRPLQGNAGGRPEAIEGKAFFLVIPEIRGESETKSMSITSMKLSFGEKFGYGLGDLAANFVFQAVMALQLDFYTKTYGLTAAQAGTMFLVVGLSSAVFNPVMGVIADRTHTRWGRFRPWLLWTSVPFGVIGILTFTTPNLNPAAKLIYAWVTYLLLRLIYAANNVPYASLTGVMTDDPERAQQHHILSVSSSPTARDSSSEPGGSHGRLPGRRQQCPGLSVDDGQLPCALGDLFPDCLRGIEGEDSARCAARRAPCSRSRRPDPQRPLDRALPGDGFLFHRASDSRQRDAALL